jgi:NAD(P)H-hydrate epimerase
MVSDAVLDLVKSRIGSLLPSRSAEGHKYTFGNVLVIGGSRRFPGAVALTSEAVLSAGAGVVTLAAPESVFESSGLVLPEVIHWPLDEAQDGTVMNAAKLIASDLSQFDVYVIGPGLGDSESSSEFFAEVLSYLLPLKKSIVLDADGLNCLSHHPQQLNEQVIITPHIGEARRLLQTTAHLDTLEMATKLREKYQAQVVLKSAQTLIAITDGHMWRNTTGNSGLATAGSGDVLTGIIAAFLAQGCKPAEAAQLGVYIHGLAGELAGEKYTQYGVRAGLISEFLAPAIKAIMVD